MKNPRRSDRQIAKILKSSQTTITRKRRALEEKGSIKEYTIIPNLYKMGFTIIGFTVVEFKQCLNLEVVEKCNEALRRENEILYCGEGEELRAIIVSVHKNYTQYNELIKKMKEEYMRVFKKPLRIVWSFKLDLSGKIRISKPFSFSYLEKLFLNGQC